MKDTKRSSTIQLYGAHASDSKLFIVTELSPIGDLYHFLKRKQQTTKTFDFGWKRKLLANLFLNHAHFMDTEELNFLNPYFWAHGNISLKNIMVTTQHNTTSQQHKHSWLFVGDERGVSECKVYQFCKYARMVFP